MGLFNKLFGKKDSAETDASAPLPATDSAAEIPPSDNGITDIQTSEATPKKKQGKRKTLPKNFKEIIEAGDIAALKVVFDECEPDARGDYYQMTALSYFNVPCELVRWLVEQGADINASDRYQNTPLHKQTGSAIAELLLDLGADIGARNKEGETPLHTAASDLIHALCGC
jgi:ankyrin repeat protein